MGRDVLWTAVPQTHVQKDKGGEKRYKTHTRRERVNTHNGIER